MAAGPFAVSDNPPRSAPPRPRGCADVDRGDVERRPTELGVVSCTCALTGPAHVLPPYPVYNLGVGLPLPRYFRPTVNVAALAVAKLGLDVRRYGPPRTLLGARRKGTAANARRFVTASGPTNGRRSARCGGPDWPLQASPRRSRAVRRSARLPPLVGGPPRGGTRSALFRRRAAPTRSSPSLVGVEPARRLVAGGSLGRWWWRSRRNGGGGRGE